MNYLVFFIVFLILLIIRFLIRTRNPNFTYTRFFLKTMNIQQTNFNIKEVIKLNPSGITFGQKGINFICRPEEEEGHVLVVGGSGSGKSSCVIIPTLLTWRESVFAIDIKGELKSKTAHKRRNIKFFEPGNYSAWGYDPFYMLQKTSSVSEVVGDIVTSLIPVPHTISDPFWIQSAQNLFKAFLIYFIHLKFSFVQSINAILSMNVVELVQEVSESTNMQARMAVMPFVGLKQETLTGIFMELSNKIMTFVEDSDLYDALSMEKTITPDDLENNSKRVYVGGKNAVLFSYCIKKIIKKNRKAIWLFY